MNVALFFLFVGCSKTNHLEGPAERNGQLKKIDLSLNLSGIFLFHKAVGTLFSFANRPTFFFL